MFCPACGTPRSRDNSGDPLIGAVLGERFLVLDRIGHGASGTIYRGEHVTLHRRVAIKVLHHELSRDELAMERFRREATTVSEIDNEHIVEIHDFGRTPDGRLYLAMELLEGEALQDVLKREKQLPVDQVVEILIQLGEALMEAHAMGYVHRDLRPRNIYLVSRRGRNFVKLLDFGLAKLVETDGDAEATSLGMTFGDPKYMSPEQARGSQVDRRADIYSLGCIVYEMLTGRAPFASGKVFDILTQQVDSMPPAPRVRRSDIPVWLDTAIMHMLSKRPDDRFVTVYRMVEALRQGLESGRAMSEERVRRRDSASPFQAPASPGATLEQFAPSSLGDDRITDHPADGDESANQEPDDRTVPSRREAGLAQSSAARPGRQKDEPERAASTPESADAAEKTPGGAKSASHSSPGRADQDDQPGETIFGYSAGPAAPQKGPTKQPASEPERSAPGQQDGGRDCMAGLPAGRSALTADATGVEPGRPIGEPEHPPDADEQMQPADSVPGAVLPSSPSGKHRIDDPSEESQTGISAAWFADGELDDQELDDKVKERLQKARATISPSDTGLILGDDVYYGSTRNRMVKIAGVVIGAFAVVIVVALAWPSSGKNRESDNTERNEASAAVATTASAGDRGAPESGENPRQVGTTEVDDMADAAAPNETEEFETPPETAPVIVSVTVPAASGSAGQPTGQAESTAGSKIKPQFSPPDASASKPKAIPGQPKTGQPKPGRPKTGIRKPQPSARKPDTNANTSPPEVREPSPADELQDPFAEPEAEKPDKQGKNSEAFKRAEFFSKVGKQALRRGDLGSAASNFKKALDLNPRDVSAIVGQGEIALRAGAYGAAIAHLKKAATMRPRSSNIQTLLGEAYLNNGQNKLAARSFRRALKLNPNNKRARSGFTEATGLIPSIK